MGKDRPLLLASAFAKYCGTTRDTLLWYDRQGLLKPASLGDNGYRYYSASQAAEFEMISLLTQAGNSLSEVRAILREGGSQDPAALFESKAQALETEIRALERMRALAGRIAGGIRAVQSCRPGIPELIEAEPAALLLTALSPEERFFADPDKNLEALNRHLRTGAAQPDVFRYPLGTVLQGEAFLRGEYDDRALFFETAAPLRGVTETRPGGVCVQVFHLDDFGQVEETLEAVRRFLRAGGWRLSGDVYEYDMLTFLQREDGLGYATRFLIPVVK